MKLATIEKYVKYSTIPYPDIINRAVKAGWEIVFQKEEVDNYGEKYINIKIKNPIAFEWFETGYCKNDITTSVFNIYTP